MRRILAGVVVLALAFSQAPIAGIGLATAKDPINYSKVWETKLEDDLTCVPVVASDGNIYGIDATEPGSETGNLVKIKDGALVWRSQDELKTLLTEIWPVLVTDENAIFSGLSSEKSKLEEDIEFVMIGYSTDGVKAWDKKIKLTSTIPTYRLYKGNVWLVYDNYARVINPKTGEETHKIDLGPTNPKPTKKTIPKTLFDKLGNKSFMLEMFGEGDKGKPDIEDFQINFLVFSGDVMILHQLDGTRAYDISSDNNLTIKWYKKYDKENVSLLSLLLLFQANPTIFLTSDASGSAKCFDSSTGEEKWTLNSDGGFLSFFFYNSTHVILVTLSGTSCFDALTKNLLWQKESMLLPVTFDENIMVLTSSVSDDFEVNKQVELIDISTGSSISKMMEYDVVNAAIRGSDLFLVKKNQLIKYSKCNPCVCDIEVYWKETKSDVIESNLCSMDSKSFEISLKNTGKEGVIDCKISPSSNKISISVNNIKVEPGQEVLVNAVYSSSINEPETFEGKVLVSSSCGKVTELKLNIKRETSCKEKLSKLFDVFCSDVYVFGNTMIYFQETSDYEFISMKAIDLKTGNQLWSLDSKSFDNVTDLYVVFRDNNSLLCASEEDEVKWFKVGIDGKVLWKRTGGYFIYQYLSIRGKRSDMHREDTVKMDLFDITTGKNVITGFKFKPNSNLIPVSQIKDKILFSYYENNYILYDAKGKVIWDKAFRLVQNNATFKTETLYIAKEGVSQEDVDLTKLAKVNPETLKPFWSVNVAGFPTILSETKDRILIYTKGGLYCFNSANGKIIWSLADGKNEYGKAILTNGKICVGQYPLLINEDDVIINSFIVLNADDGKKISETKIDDTVVFEQDDKNVYANCSWESDEGEQCYIYSIDKTSWKVSWKISVPGKAVKLGKKTFLYNDNNELSWWEDGKMVGKYQIELPMEPDPVFGGKSFNLSWDKDFIFISSFFELTVINSKTSSMAWKIKQEIDQDWDKRYFHFINLGLNEKPYDEDDEETHQMYIKVSTPCLINGMVFITDQEKLVAYKVF